MLGFEFPPFFAGGVGIVCYELTKALSKFKDIKIDYVMPYGPEEKIFSNNFKILSANSKKLEVKTSIETNLNIKKIPGTFYAYDGEYSYTKRMLEFSNKKILKNLFSSNEKSISEVYGGNLIEEVFLYALRVESLCSEDNFGIIHAHDWTTFPAAILLKKITGKPIIVHAHITEFDKSGGLSANQQVFEIEREGFMESDVIIAVSNFTKEKIVNHYGINPHKIIVVHNGGISDHETTCKNIINFKNKEKIVLFAGRITMQKGPEFFIRAAKKVLEYEPKTKFIIAGEGDMLPKIKKLTKDLGISDCVDFHGFFSRDEAEFLFKTVDIFVMPSVSEPFGIVPLEAISKGTPVIISKQSGISEVLKNSLKVDFWDTDELANKIIALLRYEPLHKEISRKGYEEFTKFDWKKPAKKIVEIYNSLI